MGSGSDPSLLFLTEHDAQEFKRRFIDPLGLLWPTRIVKPRSTNYMVVRVDNGFDFPIYCKLVHAQKGAKFNPIIAQRVNSISSGIDEDRCVENLRQLANDIDTRLLPCLKLNVNDLYTHRFKEFGDMALTYDLRCDISDEMLKAYGQISGKLAKKTLKESDTYNLSLRYRCGTYALEIASRKYYKITSDFGANNIQISNFAGKYSSVPLSFIEDTLDKIGDLIEDVFDATRNKGKNNFYADFTFYLLGLPCCILLRYSVSNDTLMISPVLNMTSNDYAATEKQRLNLPEINANYINIDKEFNLSEYTSEIIDSMVTECIGRVPELSTEEIDHLKSAYEEMDNFVNQLISAMKEKFRVFSRRLKIILDDYSNYMEDNINLLDLDDEDDN